MNSNPQIQLLIRQYEDVYSGKVWMGNNMKKKLDSLEQEEAFRRPLPSLHSVAELIAHLTAWKQDALLKIREGKGKLMDFDEANWPDNESLKKVGWSELLQKYEASHIELINELCQKDDAFLMETYEDQDFKATFNYSFAIEGILHHDIYHLGQIGIVIKLLKENASSH